MKFIDNFMTQEKKGLILIKGKIELMLKNKKYGILLFINSQFLTHSTQYPFISDKPHHGRVEKQWLSRIWQLNRLFFLRFANEQQLIPIPWALWPHYHLISQHLASIKIHLRLSDRNIQNVHKRSPNS